MHRFVTKEQKHDRARHAVGEQRTLRLRSCRLMYERVVRPSDTLTLVPLVGAVLSDDRGKRRSCGEHAREREYEAEAQQDGALHWQRQG